jgi:hypothetical protein
MRAPPPLLALIAVVFLAGCPKQATTNPTSTVAAGADPAGPSAVTTTQTNEGLVEVRVDLNRDGRHEITNYYRERSDAPRLLRRKETDLDLKGGPDVWTWYDDSGQREREEMDGDFDGRVDWKDYYVGGKRSMSEVDTDFNGTFDLKKYYENGIVRRRERDSNADGRVDAWEYLDESGKVIKTGRDVDGDGTMDERDQ